jgi:glutaryl-CoA dehydrogenase
MGAAEFCWHAGAAIRARPQAVRQAAGQTQLFQKKLADMQTEIALGLQARCASGG